MRPNLIHTRFATLQQGRLRLKHMHNFIFPGAECAMAESLLKAITSLWSTAGRKWLHNPLMQGTSHLPRSDHGPSLHG